MNTLAERLKIALKESGKTKTDIWRACGISSGAVSFWFNGATQNLEGNNLLTTANLLGVNPEWLATGRGQMRSGEAREAPAPELDPREQAMLGLFQGLTQRQQDEMLRNLEKKKQTNDELLNELLKRKAG